MVLYFSLALCFISVNPKRFKSSVFSVCVCWCMDFCCVHKPALHIPFLLRLQIWSRCVRLQRIGVGCISPNCVPAAVWKAAICQRAEPQTLEANNNIQPQSHFSIPWPENNQRRVEIGPKKRNYVVFLDLYPNIMPAPSTYQSPLQIPNS